MKNNFEPFPNSIDRNYFGAWLSGFVDGEGCFRLTCQVQSGRDYKQPATLFVITLRDDDSDALLLIQSYLNMGRIYTIRGSGASKPKSSYRVFSLEDCVKLCEHFRSFPLIAKKKRDFEIWKDGVMLLQSYNTWIRSGKTKFGRKWTEDMILEFEILCAQLRDIREYEETESAINLRNKNTHDNDADCPE